MREILFRGKRTENGEWVEGYLTLRPSAIQYEANNSPWYIEVPPRDPDARGNSYNVDGSTVGEFTGLTDKKGKKIFEGDIVKQDNSSYRGFDIGVVYWNKQSSQWKRTSVRYSHIKNFTFVMMHSCVYEVIGNIYDTPELLSEERAENENL